MNTLQILLTIGLFSLFLVYAVAPISNVASNVIDDSNSLTGFSGFFFGNLTFQIFIIFMIVIFYMMWAG